MLKPCYFQRQGWWRRDTRNQHGGHFTSSVSVHASLEQTCLHCSHTGYSNTVVSTVCLSVGQYSDQYWLSVCLSQWVCESYVGQHFSGTKLCCTCMCTTMTTDLYCAPWCTRKTYISVTSRHHPQNFSFFGGAHGTCMNTEYSNSVLHSVHTNKVYNVVLYERTIWWCKMKLCTD